MNPKITIITVARNAVATIEQTILSVLNQTYPNIEYIIIDGASTDGTIEIIKKYEDKIDYWISEPDTGIYNAMNKGIDHATGDWYFFLGSDDILIDKIENIMNDLKNSNCIYYGNVKLLSNNQIYLGKFNSIKLISRNIPHQAIFYPKRVFETFKYDIKYKILADYVLNIQCWGKFKFNYINRVIVLYNDKGISSVVHDKLFFKNKQKIFLHNMPYYAYPYIILRNILSMLKKR